MSENKNAVSNDDDDKEKDIKEELHRPMAPKTAIIIKEDFKK